MYFRWRVSQATLTRAPTRAPGAHDPRSARSPIFSRTLSSARIGSRSSIQAPMQDAAKRGVGLFAGIGGFELGLSRAGHETLLLCENDAGANAVLDSHFPNIGMPMFALSPSFQGDTDLMTAGFPCQDLSQAGKTAGIPGKNSGLIGCGVRSPSSARSSLAVA
ncbi:MAG: DNA cytosine methyltransferase [Geminicoccaceae bacterium]